MADTETPTPATDTPPGSEAGEVVIIGAGPAGLTAAYELAQARASRRRSSRPTRSSAASAAPSSATAGASTSAATASSPRCPRSRTSGTRSCPTRTSCCGPRMSRIYYDGKFFDYPLAPINALRRPRPRRGGPLRAARTSWVRIRPPKDQTTFEGWIASRFGWRLYRIFFKTYTEKVWGVPGRPRSRPTGPRSGSRTCRSARPSINALLPEAQPEGDHVAHRGVPVPEVRARDDVGGAAASKVEAAGTKVADGAPVVTQIEHDDGRAVAVVAETDGVAHDRTPCTDVISSMPISALLRAMDPPAPAEVLAAADELTYRDFLTVALVVPEDVLRSPTTGSTSTSPTSSVGRIQNFGSWSPYMVKDGRTCLGLEYFVYEGDELWDDGRRRPRRRSASASSRTSASSTPTQVEAGYVVRMPKAYPVYDDALQGERRRHARVARASTRPTCIPSAATACTSTTTRTTRCSPRC